MTAADRCYRDTLLCFYAIFLLEYYFRSKMGKTNVQPQLWWNFRATKSKTIYHSNKKTESRFVISMQENHLVQIFISCVEILTKAKFITFPTP